MESVFGLGRWVSRALAATVLLMAIALMSAVWSSYVSVQRASARVALGEGEALLRAVRHRLVGRRPSPADLQAVLSARAAAGLRYLGFFDREGHFFLEAGTPSRDTHELGRNLFRIPPDVVINLGTRWRMVGHPPPPPGARPPDPNDFEPPPPPPGRPPGPPPFAIEFESVLAASLITEARRALVTGVVATVALIAGAFALVRLLKQRALLQTQREREHQLAMLGEMSTVLAHEIRNPLAALKGHAQLLGEMLPEPSAEHDKADTVVREAVRLETLTETLLDFARASRIERHATDPAALLRSAAATVDGTRVALHVGRAPATWSLDAARMQQVITNLLRNALQATPAGTVEASLAVEDAQLILTVRDTGAGIPLGTEQEIFEPFVTRRPHGTGLGLAVSRQVVALHGGSIVAFNHPEGGAVFRVAIPAQ